MTPGAPSAPDGPSVPVLCGRVQDACADLDDLMPRLRHVLVEWRRVLVEVELVASSAVVASIEDHVALRTARDTLFDLLGELSALADPYVVQALAAEEQGRADP